jgi:peptidoglycan/xylan/chitin deacetylase (PgdA/CDA1 family)
VGGGKVEQTVVDIAATGLATPVVVCGRNEALRARLVAAGHRHVMGWVDDMAALIRACDVIVQNSGGLTAAEALVSAVPVLTYRCLPGHGRTNAAALDAEGLVPWARSSDQLARALTCAGAGGPTASAESDDGAFRGRLRRGAARAVRGGGAGGVLRSAVVASVTLAAAEAAPAALFLPPVRKVLAPQLAGRGDPGHVALTFDDGPHPEATPGVLAVLRRHGVRATFFVLGHRLALHPRLGDALVDEGHEIAVHGWDHRCLLGRGPLSVYDDLARTADVVERRTGARPLWMRAPYGVFTTSALLAGRRLGLTPVLWTCWGYDWTRRATPGSVAATTLRGLTGGGTILLPDSDVASAPRSWRATLGALPWVLAHCRARGFAVGPLAEHGAAPGVRR